MKLCIQRVTNASVSVAGETVASIGKGLLVLVGIGHDDGAEQTRAMIKKILGIRLWDDLKNPSRAWASNVVENGYEVLLVSQFTLYGHLKGHKPDYHLAMPPSDAKPYYENFVSQCQATYPGKVQSGVFGAYMEVSLTNDGPITMMLDSPVTTVPKHIQAKEAKAAKAAATEAASASAAVPVPEAEAETVTENKEK